MTSSILNVGKTALAAAQAGLITTGHNIANANTAGYSRQTVVQGPALAQDLGNGYIGKGTEVVTVERTYNDFITGQMRTAQTNAKSLEAYFQQVSQIDTLLADPTAGLSPAMQDFFAGVQNVAANPSDRPARQTLLSSAEALVSRFQSMDARFNEIRDGVNSAISSSVSTINSYAGQIAALNDQIEKAQSTAGEAKPANDLLDQRDQVITELSNLVKVSVVKQGNSYNVFIGNGQPLTVGTQTFTLAATTSPTDVSRTAIGVVSNGVVTALPEAVLSGGTVGGLYEFRSQILDTAQNSLGRVATGLAMTFNQQHQLGMDLYGAIGTNFFNAAEPVVTGATTNNAGTAAAVSADIVDPSALTISDYRLQYAAGTYRVLRLSDNTMLYNNAAFPPPGTVIDGFTVSLDSGSFSANDEFIIKPVLGGASGLSVATNDISRIAMAAPITTSAPLSNSGSGKISAGVVNAPPPVNANLTQPVTITFTSPTTFNVTGTGTGNPTGLTYTPGANISYNGWTINLTGAPANGDTFSISSNNNGVADGRNAVLLGALQTANTLGKIGSGSPTLSFQSSYGQLVNLVGSKAYEVKVTSSGADKLLVQARDAQQAVSGVNLDEEATNLLRYQQAYQAAGKVMQTASELFELLLNLGQ